MITFKLLLTLVFALTMSACYKTVQMSPEDIQSRPLQKVKSVNVPVAIVGAEMHSGNSYECEPQAGLYFSDHRHIVGMESSRNPISIAMDSVLRLSIRSVIDSPEVTVTIEPKAVAELGLQNGLSVRNGIVYRMAQRIALEPRGGSYDVSKREINGSTKVGETVRIAITDIASVEVERFDITRTVKCFVAVGLVVAMIHSLDNWSWGDGPLIKGDIY